MSERVYEVRVRFLGTTGWVSFVGNDLKLMPKDGASAFAKEMRGEGHEARLRIATPITEEAIP